MCRPLARWTTVLQITKKQCAVCAVCAVLEARTVLPPGEQLLKRKGFQRRGVGEKGGVSVAGYIASLKGLIRWPGMALLGGMRIRAPCRPIARGFHRNDRLTRSLLRNGKREDAALTASQSGGGDEG